jgi:beta-phosphoglucomutase-like phosphatase (HAD superfamily)
LQSKPSPEIFYAVLKTIKKDRSVCLAIDDSWAGVEAAKKIHLKVIGVSRQLFKTKPDIYVSDLNELKPWMIEEC